MIRYEFIDTSIKEKDIHPDFIFSREKELAQKFLSTIELSNQIEPCPVCNNLRDEILFQKWGYSYVICPNTWTVSLATFPKEEVFKNYFFHSELSEFRGSKKYQDLVTSRRKSLWENQIGWIENRVIRYLGKGKYRVLDWGSKYVGWIDYLDTTYFLDTLMTKESLPPIIESRNIDKKFNIICLIDVIQREIQPFALIKRVSQYLKSGGLLIIFSRCGSGFDILTLREVSESIFPFDHIFLPSPKGLQLLLHQAGFDVLELTTPGLMDVKYVEDADRKIPKDQYFQRYIIDQKDEFLFERMQGFLQRNNLSSHMRCISRKK